MKTVFELEQFNHNKRDAESDGCIHIIGRDPEHLPYVFIKSQHYEAYIRDKDLKLFAKNLCKALNFKP